MLRSVASCGRGHPLRSALPIRCRPGHRVGGGRPRRPLPGMVAVARRVRRLELLRGRHVALRGRTTRALRTPVRDDIGRRRRRRAGERGDRRGHRWTCVAHRHRSRSRMRTAAGVGSTCCERGTRGGDATRPVSRIVRARLGSRRRRPTIPSPSVRPLTGYRWEASWDDRGGQPRDDRTKSARAQERAEPMKVLGDHRLAVAPGSSGFATGCRSSPNCSSRRSVRCPNGSAPSSDDPQNRESARDAVYHWGILATTTTTTLTKAKSTP